MYNRHFSPIKAALALVLVLSVASCATHKKLSNLNKTLPEAQLALSNERNDIPQLANNPVARDTLKIQDDDGKEILIMKAIKDEETGEMVANEVLDAAIVTARFRNIAERNGKVDLAFQVVVPPSMQDSKWQLRFYPDMYVLQDTIKLDPVIITGKAYRKAQTKGYQQYQKFLETIISDTTVFINIKQLEIFLKRNIPQVYAFKTDTTYVSDEMFYSYYGVSEQEAVQHYTNANAVKRNDRRKARMDKMYNKYVKSPIVTEGIRLDTVIVGEKGDFIYNYIQTINTRPELRKADIVLEGDIYELDKKIYTIPRSEPLTFYISSISAFTSAQERYLTKIVERQAEANTACYVDFATGKSNVDEKLGNNEEEIARIKENLADLMSNRAFDLDSIVVTASASPEGKRAMNEKLAQERSESISKYLNKYIKSYQDELEYEQGFSVDESGNVTKEKRVKIPFISRSDGENWRMLDLLVKNDKTMTDEQKEHYASLSTINDVDAREARMQGQPYYKYLRENVYPRLRTVRFNFYLHRKGMIQDTVHTTVIDSTYMRGVKALQDMDYDTALLLLRPYSDFNTAVAYTALNRNASAMMILSTLERTAEVNYLLAILYSRNGEIEKAVSCYIQSCKQNPSYVYRGNLDPEISALISTYGLNKEDDIPLDI